MVRAARIDEVGNPDLLLRCHLDRAQSDGGIVRLYSDRVERIFRDA